MQLQEFLKKATTGGELADAIKKAREHRGGPVLIECQIEHDDCSPQLLKWGARLPSPTSVHLSKPIDRGKGCTCEDQPGELARAMHQFVRGTL